MIITGNSRSDWRTCARRIMRGGKITSGRLVEVVGLAGDDVPYAFQQMYMISLATRCENFFYHASINPRAHELLTERQWEQAVGILGRNLGLEDHSRFVVERAHDGRVHRQVVWSRISHALRTAPDYLSWRVHTETAQQLEELFGHEPTSRRRRRKAWAAAKTRDAPEEEASSEPNTREDMGARPSRTHPDHPLELER